MRSSSGEGSTWRKSGSSKSPYSMRSLKPVGTFTGNEAPNSDVAAVLWPVVCSNAVVDFNGAGF